ncbi:hypothetical protein MOMOMIXON_199 [Mycobacterium phage MoMoMixon]|uniref:Uncharacterized protein n=3 Tax=Bixzunavirus Bxz1 TaxID=2006134 RepID=G8IDC9_9CAUD|nr:hypothetical protein MOMOMIXON_199 [Mycobacterium phage MoMoMixon]AER49689.1 hypothetical protein PIO_209 [Mycobacterium phage Pio]AOZ63524.1 hypothetical protein SEA_GABRIEL_204 [Mycobacterium phage Gabriel]AZF97869.1 hypothetical protein SEA_BURROUGH_203 [Mycobacterium phage Burrough]QAY06393.1 hypothetical protein SEA_FRAYBELL_204 [Mycobacterium phage FrayBell]QAY08217.1 hypothetical protein SEA_KAMRYN_200 [Mycobacterium phage Kamryn]UTN92659.1 hypothetical protein SEA_MIKRO_197 [Mycoba
MPGRLPVDGHCPACGRKSLGVRTSAIREDSELRCFYPDCPDPEAVAKLLSDPEIHHVLEVKEGGIWTLQHPLRERIDGGLFDCPLAAVLAQKFAFNSPPEPGRYRMKSQNTDNYRLGPWESEKL